MGIVGRAVERIDDPPVARVATAARAALLTQDAVGWKGRPEGFTHLLLALQVDVGDDVDNALVANLADGIDPPTQNITRRSGGLDANLACATEIEMGVQVPGYSLTYFFVNRAALGGATFSGGRRTIAPLSQAASHK